MSKIRKSKPSLLERLPGDLHRQRPFRGAMECGAGLRGDALELRDRGRAMDVGAGEQRALVFPFQPAGELAGKRGLAGALQAREQHHGRQMGRAGERHRGLAEQAYQLLVHDPDHLLAGSQAPQHLFARGARFDPRHKVLGDRDLHVGLEQGAAHVAQGFADVVGAEPPLTAEVADDPVKTCGKCLEQRSSYRREAGKIAQRQKPENGAVRFVAAEARAGRAQEGDWEVVKDAPHTVAWTIEPRGATWRVSCEH